MDKKFIDKFRGKLQTTDILLEELPLLNKETKYNVIGYHGTRLFDEEYEDLMSNGFKVTDKSLFYRKLAFIENKQYRTYLQKKLERLKYTQSAGNIYLKFGRNEFSEVDTIFLNNWGGETIYNLYDKNGLETQYEKRMGEYLRSRTKPYVIVCRVKDQLYNEEILKCKTAKKYGTSNSFPVNDIEIVDIIEVTVSDILGVK